MGWIRQRGRTFVFTTPACLIALCGFALLACRASAYDLGQSSPPAANAAPVSQDLRGAYNNRGKGQESPSSLVGRLSLQKIVNGAGMEVRTDHRFRSGENFRFSVSANRDGWLYVLHRSNHGKMQYLWPPESQTPGGQQEERNRIVAGQTIAIPPAPGRFTFDAETGEEYFYVLIRSSRKKPALSEFVAELPRQPGSPSIPVKTTSASPPETSGARIVNMKVRGAQTSEAGIPYRGVVFDPGAKDGDPALYFTAHPDDNGEAIMCEFQLHHE